ncbi:MAG: PAC2 family protein, partial [Acidimicrobiales bacterium]
MCLEGWIDAGLGAGAAMAALLGTRTTEPLVTWDGDELIDHRARRPVLHLVDGVAEDIAWPTIELR